MISEAFEGLCEVCGIDIDDVDFLDNATNVYRTEEFIVSQHICFSSDGPGTTRILSEDTYYRRTKLRDLLYEKLFENDGKRLHSSMFVRTYIE